MEKNVLSCFVLLFCTVTWITCLEIKEDKENLKDISLPTSATHHLRAVHHSATNESAVIPTEKRSSVDFHRIFDLWNPLVLIDVWKNKKRDFQVSERCFEDFSTFLDGLESSTSWAFRMLDASGRHNWGLFSGSKYWIGASDQCRQMDHDFTEIVKINRTGESHVKPDIPPFRVSVNSVKLVLDILQPGISGSHDITIGICTPSSCRPRDLERIIHFSSNEMFPGLPRRVTVRHVRNLSEGYDLWDDPIFYVISISVVLVILLVTFGTMYDLALRYRVLNGEENVREKRMKNNESEEDGRCVEGARTTGSKINFEGEITMSKLWSIEQHNGSLDVWNAKDVPRPLSEALLSFSLLLNVSKLASLDVGTDTLAPIHGLRFVSIIWIILVHTCLMVNEVADNKMFRSKAEEDFLYQTISNGTYAVDTFFFISGCLVSFLYFRTITKERIREKKITQGFSGKILQFLGMMSYRYFRLTPPYLLVIGLIQISNKWYHDHSVIELTTLDHETCEKFWWRNALYINTYFDMDERCMVWSWYLANDTQFYTIGTIVLIIGASFVSVAAAIAIVILIASWITTAVITLNTGHLPTIEEPFAHYESLYDKPWTRIGPYLIGMAAGWYLCKIECKLKMNKIVALVGWSLSIVTLLSIVYGLYGNNFDPVSSALYTALSHSGWALSVGFVMIACVTGNSGGIDKILSWKYIYPLSRLTYCVYLVHPALTRAMILRGESSFHLTQGFVESLSRLTQSH
ncbi:nose resistant to fluoxetine protein 6-like isoform X2 [Venturia canescens]|uniref:nose resistant to fluoxetine protein 6-like isoform X2 n=1 Tax=Venturia canescens TaxID=32260 RepID=UPI001C9C45C4|nr:nose resistant to fluoxetine protein 6-like isoform X2 [Venturia canescens]